MWAYLISLGVECMLIGELFRRYFVRRKARLKSDYLRLAQEHYKTAKMRVNLEELAAQRNLVAEIEGLLQ